MADNGHHIAYQEQSIVHKGIATPLFRRGRPPRG
jgi:hypothetical protein